MDSIKLNFLHLCDAASVDGLGKINILGIFTKIYLQKVPSKFLKFTIVGNISFQKLSEPKVKIEIKIFDQNKIEVQIASLEFKALGKGKNNSGDINIVLDLGNIEFKSFGKYSLIVYADGKELGNRPFLVEERVVEKKYDIN
jgi:hypothetical protein